MAFSDASKKISWDVAKGKCECRISSHNHPGGCCDKVLDWNKNGRGSNGYWEAHHLDGNPNNDSAGNCGTFCWHCHELTL